MRVLGVDPGGRGALALLDGNSLDIEDMPVFAIKRGRTTVREVNVHALIDLLAAWQPDVCWYENVGARFGEAAKSSFNFGRISGACEAICKTTGARFEFVSPNVWKRHLRIPGKHNEGADAARARACELWPRHAALFKRKMDDGRADAALIALYGRQMDGTGAAPDLEVFA